MIGIILATYTTDNLIEEMFGSTYGIQVIPDISIITEKSSWAQPFVGNFFSLSIGLFAVGLISFCLKSLDFNKSNAFETIKMLCILTFCGSSISFFLERFNYNSWNDISLNSLSAGYVIGIISFSFSQSLSIN
jgi:hypothetical protein